ncbi:MAG: addiction module toxin RelE [Nanoarchaeota archaeon]
MYDYGLRKEVEDIFFKLAKKNSKQLEIIYKRIDEIRQNPQHYKNLRSPLQDYKRVHIDKSFVLIFSVDENAKNVIIEYYDHHDNVYKWRPKLES